MREEDHYGFFEEEDDDTEEEDLKQSKIFNKEEREETIRIYHCVRCRKAYFEWQIHNNRSVCCRAPLEQGLYRKVN